MPLLGGQCARDDGGGGRASAAKDAVPGRSSGVPLRRGCRGRVPLVGPLARVARGSGASTPGGALPGRGSRGVLRLHRRSGRLAPARGAPPGQGSGVALQLCCRRRLPPAGGSPLPRLCRCRLPPAKGSQLRRRNDVLLLRLLHELCCCGRLPSAGRASPGWGSEFLLNLLRELCCCGRLPPAALAPPERGNEVLLLRLFCCGHLSPAGLAPPERRSEVLLLRVCCCDRLPPGRRGLLGRCRPRRGGAGAAPWPGRRLLGCRVSTVGDPRLPPACCRGHGRLRLGSSSAPGRGPVGVPLPLHSAGVILRGGWLASGFASGGVLREGHGAPLRPGRARHPGGGRSARRLARGRVVKCRRAPAGLDRADRPGGGRSAH
mmetsp:Transcript_84423/g.261204  ORF Transcript_84423/g.261204 Transcript_84423/m.261204 type:complete len:376 (+) Transcript_84423:1332-2459(+)